MLTPKWLITKERANHGRFTTLETHRCRACATVMYNGRYFREKPVMRRVIKQEYVLWDIHFTTTKTAPSFRDESTYPCHFDGLEDHVCEGVGVIDDYASETDVDRWFAGVEEFD